MKHIIFRTVPALLIAALLLMGSTAAYAADTPQTSSDTVDALHNGAPPAMPTPAVSDPQAAVPSLPAVETPPPPEPSEEPFAITPTMPALYPTDVQNIEDNGIPWVTKTYELGVEESPDGIPRESFALDGWWYELADITKKETAAADTQDHTETVTVNTNTKDMEAILKLLAPTLDYTSDDGYTGTLTLDIASIKVETAGTKTSSYTVSATREYPYLSRNDTALIPKTITDNGRTLTLDHVDWSACGTVAVDNDQLPESYTAVATYTGTASKTAVTGYVTIADYTGSVAKIIPGKTIYMAYFYGTEIAEPEPEPSPAPTPVPTPTPTPTPAPKSTNPLPIAAGATGGAGLLCGVVFFFFLRKNVKVHNLKDGKYMPIGGTRVTKRNPVINLTPFADKAATGSFILVLDKSAAKNLSGKTVTVNYGDKSLQHIIESGGGEYQFEVDF